MAVDMFIKIDGIKGESADDKHKEEVDVLSWSWGMSQSGSAHMGGGAGAGKAWAWNGLGSIWNITWPFLTTVPSV